MKTVDIISWIQVTSSIILAFITTVYVIITNKILHSTHKTYIKVIDVNFNNGKTEVTVKNIGANVAINMQMFSRVHTDYEPDPLGGLKIWITIKYLPAEGFFEIQPGEEKKFYFDSSILGVTLKDPFIVKWKTISGCKQKTIWKYIVYKNYQPSREKLKLLNECEFIKYKLYILFTHVFVSPWKKLQLKIRQKRAKRNK